MEIDFDRIDEAVLALLFSWAPRQDSHLEVLPLVRHGAVACKGIYLGPGSQGEISSLHRARFAPVRGPVLEAIREALSVNTAAYLPQHRRKSLGQSRTALPE